MTARRGVREPLPWSPVERFGGACVREEHHGMESQVVQVPVHATGLTAVKPDGSHDVVGQPQEGEGGVGVNPGGEW